MKIYSHFTPKSLVVYKNKVNFEGIFNKIFEKKGNGIYSIQLKR